MHAEALPAMPATKTQAEQCPNSHEEFQLRNSCGNLIQKCKNEEETDAMSADEKFSFQYYDILSTGITIISRIVAIYINIKLILDFYEKGEFEYFLWTIICLCASLVITSIIHCYMCYDDAKFKRGLLSSVRTCLWILLASVFVRYYKTLIYAIHCRRAEKRGDKENQIHFYRLAMNEESDVAFMKLFECFLETGTQKILQISIVLSQKNERTDLQTVAICIYFGSMAWCLSVYNRYVRKSQEDKFQISNWGLICQLFWYFFLSVSRTLSIAFLASIFPLYTIYGCIGHIAIAGIIIFIADRPQRPKAIFSNFIFCLLMGIIYLFTYISMRDGRTRYKYTFYYASCLLENVICIGLFANFASNEMKSSPIKFYTLCSVVLSFYVLGIIISIIYYCCFHPNITARKSKCMTINNN